MVIMLAQTLINIRIDEDLKKSMESVCKELGINISTAFTIFAKKLKPHHPAFLQYKLQ